MKRTAVALAAILALAFAIATPLGGAQGAGPTVSSAAPQIAVLLSAGVPTGVAASPPLAAALVVPSAPVHPESPPIFEGESICGTDGSDGSCTISGAGSFDVDSGWTLVLIALGGWSGTGSFPTPTVSGDAPTEIAECQNDAGGGRGDSEAWVVVGAAAASPLSVTFTGNDGGSYDVTGIAFAMANGNVQAVGDCEDSGSGDTTYTVAGGSVNDYTFAVATSFAQTTCSPPTAFLLTCIGGASTGNGLYAFYQDSGPSPDSLDPGFGSGGVATVGFAFAVGGAPLPTFVCSIAFPADNYSYFEGPVSAYFNVTGGTEPYEYEIQWGDGSENETVDSTSASVLESHTYTATIVDEYGDGPYFAINATVYDVTPAYTPVCSSTVQVYVAPHGLTLSVYPSSPTTNDTTVLSASIIAPPGIYAYTWTLGNGAHVNEIAVGLFYGNGVEPACTELPPPYSVWSCPPLWINTTAYYVNAGAYTATLSLTDGLGVNHSASETVHLTKGSTGSGRPPCVNCGGGGISFLYPTTDDLIVLVVVVLAVLAVAAYAAKKPGR